MQVINISFLGRYKDLINNFPEDIKSDRYIGIVLNKIAQYGSVCMNNIYLFLGCPI